MANNEICVFCGEKLGLLSSSGVRCGDVFQQSCRNCAKEVNPLSEDEKCRRALRLGLANEPDKLKAHLELHEQAESHRPACTRCGEKLIFQQVQCLDNSPIQNNMFTGTFDVVPACCPACGKYEFYNPDIVRKHKYLVLLARKDIAKQPLLEPESPE